MAKQNEKMYIEASAVVWEEMGALEALRIAIYNEQAAFDFYSTILNVMQNEGGKNTFTSLAEDEKRHRHA